MRNVIINNTQMPTFPSGPRGQTANLIFGSSNLPVGSNDKNKKR